MIKLTIINKDEYSNYILEDNEGNNYELNINFIGIEIPKIGSEIFIQESVINEKVSLNYGIIDNNRNPSEEELIAISFDGNQNYLQRYYG